MVRILQLGILLITLSFSTSCSKADVTFSEDLTVKTTEFSIEKLECDLNSSVQWSIEKSSNYLQKDIKTVSSGTLRFVLTSDDFCAGPYGYRIVVFVNNKITLRRSLQTFPFESIVEIPANSLTTVQTYMERIKSIPDNCDKAGRVSNRVYLQ